MDSLLIKGCERLAGTVFDFNFENYSVVMDYIYIAIFQPNYSYGKHMHSFYELHYIVKGRGRVGIEAQQFELKKGDFYITGPHIEHWQIADAQEPMVEYCMHLDFKARTFENHQVISTHNDEKVLFTILEEKTRTVVQDQNNLEGLFNLIFLEAAGEKIGYSQVITQYITAIIYAAARNFHEGGSDDVVPKITLNQYRVEVIKKYIYDNLNQKLNYEQISHYMFLSKRHLERIIKQETGETLHDMILSIKVTKAIYYLEHSYMKLKEIAELTGFTNEFHLSRTVKQFSGKNPTEYKKLV